MPHLAVVGAGIGGLAAADRVAREHPDWQVTVLDAADRVGGKLRLGEVGGVRVDLGAESALARVPEAVELIERLGLALVHPATTSAWLVRGGRLRPLPTGTVMGVPADPVALARSRALSPRELALTAARAHRSREAPPLTGDVAVGRLLAARLGRSVVDRLVDPLLGGVYAGRADELSLAATVPTLYAALTRTGDVLAAARQARPAPTGATVFASVRGGLGLLPVALADDLRARGVVVRTGATVRELARTPSGWRLVVGPTCDPEPLEVDAVVLACPTTASARLLAPALPHAADRLAQVRWASVALVTLVLPTGRVALPAGSGMLVPAVEECTVKAATFWSAKWGWPGKVAPDRVVVRASVGRHGDERTLQREDADLVAAVRADLARLVGLAAQPVDTAVTRWGGGLPQYAPGHLDLVAEVHDDVARHPGLAVCGAGLDGVGVPAVIRSARRAADRAVSRLARSDQGER